jgi:EAL domain-containing protein (putative c-di-GMP-specific phosphodiesterase class I)
LIRQGLEQPFLIEGGEFYVSASIGIAVAEPDSTSHALLAAADAAMYAAKEAGRNGYVVFDHALRDQMTAWSQVQHDLYRAIDQHEMDLDLQPIVTLDGVLVGYEALARWNHPSRGRLSPAEFISVAEESGLIERLGSQLLGQGAAHAAALGTMVSVNVSGRQFNRNLVQRVAALIEHHSLDHGQLVIEITESAIIDTEHAKTVLRGLREAGAVVWIDDFGTGFSSLARLSSLTVDGLKLPREFVMDLDSPQVRGIAAAICGLGRTFGISVIAEGIETPEQLDLVRQLGCDAAQGYLLGRPAPSAITVRNHHEGATWTMPQIDRSATGR